jgi:Ulp1 family protease
MTPRCARGKNIFNMRYIFIPIYHGLHYMCAVIYMQQMKIEYYDSLLYDNITRHGCRHKVKKARGDTSSSKRLLAKGTYERKAHRFAQ